MSFGLRAAALTALSLVFLAGCASNQQKARREQREKAIQNTRLYCEFLNGEQYPDIDVALNLAMAQKCDADKSMTITDYKSPSEIPGVMFCCSVHARFLPQRTEMPPGKMTDMPKAEPRHEPKPAPPKAIAAPAPTPAPSEVKSATATETSVSSKTETKAEVKSENKTEVKTETKSDDDELDK